MSGLGQRRNLCVFLGLLLLGLLVHYGCLSAPIYYDDEYVIKQNLWIQFIPPGTWFGQMFSDSSHFFRSYRPTLIASYWLNAKLPIDLFLSLRLGTILIHVFNAFLLFLLLQTFLKKKSLLPPLLAAMLFTVHPLQTIGVVFVWKRSSILCCTWILCGLLHALKSRRLGSFILGQILFYGLALTTKEEGIIYPAFLGILLYVHPRKEHSKLLTKGTYISVAALALAALAWIQLQFGISALDLGSRLFSAEGLCHEGPLGYLRASLSVVPKYFQYMLLPEPRILDEPIRSCSWFTSEAKALYCFVLSSVLMIYYLGRHWALLFLGILWIGFIPTQTFQPLFLIMDQIRIYTPLLGFAGLFGLLVSRFDSNKWIRTGCLVLVLAYAAWGARQSYRYRNLENIWMDVAAAYPQSFVAWDNLGAHFERTMKYPKAIYSYKMASKANPANVDFPIRELISRLRGGETKKTVIEDFHKIPIYTTTDAMAILHSALLASELDLLDIAEKQAKHFLRYFPGYAFGHYVLGTVYEKTSREHEAWKAYTNTVELDADFIHAKQRLEALKGKGIVGPGGP